MVTLKKNKALFLDRDGIINVDFNYVHKYEDIVYVDGIFRLVDHFNKLNYSVFVVTNQSGISRGYYSEKDVNTLHNKLNDDFLKKTSGGIAEWVYCKHLPDDNCICRKPATGMIQEIQIKYEIDIENSVLIGDKVSDFELGLNAKIKNIFIMDSQYLSLADKNRINASHQVIHSLEKIIETI